MIMKKEIKEIGEGTLGNVKVDNEVIKSIALKAATEVKGIYRKRNSFIGNIFERITKKEAACGVKLISTPEAELKITLDLTVRYGVDIPSRAGMAQENVKTAIEQMTGLSVSEINIKISQIFVDRSADIGGGLDTEKAKSVEDTSIEDLGIM